MTRLVYLDVHIVANLLVNYVILLSAGKLLGREPKRSRLMLASSLGTLYAVWALISPSSAAFSVPGRLAFGVFMAAVAYPCTHGLAIVPIAASLFLCSALAAGTALAVGRRSGPMLQSSQNPSAVYWWALGLSLVLVSIFPAVGRLGGYARGGRLPLQGLEVQFLGKTIRVMGLVDTGNNLRDPVSGLPVVVVDWDALRSAVPEEAAPFFLLSWGDIPADLAESPCGLRLRLVPYEGLAGQRGVLPGFRPDALNLVGSDGVRTPRAAVVCTCGEPCSPTGLYQALLHPDLACP